MKASSSWWLYCLAAVGSLSAASALAATPLPRQLHAQVTYVTDGDTVQVEAANRAKHAVRIVSIDAPEKGRRGAPGQRYAEKSRRHLAALIDGKRVLLVTRGRDDYGRVLARVWIGDMDVGLTQVCAGYAWVFRAFVDELPADEQRIYLGCEAEAKRNKRGLWRDAQPTPPWVWRHTRRDVETKR